MSIHPHRRSRGALSAAASGIVGLLVSLAGLVLIPGLAAQSNEPLDEEDLARRTFTNAEQLMREGKTEQALREYGLVARTYGESGLADDALFRIGEYYYPGESIDDLGTAQTDRLLKAQESLSQIPSKYPTEAMAPRALLKLGLIALEPANPDRDIDEAYASFSGVVNIYPGSEVVDRALLGAGFADMAARKYESSIQSFERVVERYPQGSAAENARYYMGLAFEKEGSWTRALEALQSLRDHHPQGKLARPALDRLTLIYKTRVEPGQVSRPIFSFDPGYKPALDDAAAKGGVSLAVGADGAAHVLYMKTGQVVVLGADGAVRSEKGADPATVSISLDDAGNEVLAGGGRFLAGSSLVLPQRLERGALRPLSEITAAVRISPLAVAVLDGESNEVLLYRGNPSDLEVIYSDREKKARLTGLARGAGENLYTIDKRAGRVIEIPAEGASRDVTVNPGPGAPALEPEAIAADILGNIYVLDRRNDAVVVNTSAGGFLQRIESKPGTAIEFSYPSAIAAGPRGEVYLYDEKRKTILRFW